MMVIGETNVDINRDVTVHKTGCLTFAVRVRRRLVAFVLAVLAVFSSAQLAHAVSITLEGQDKSALTWGSKLQNWVELDCMNCRENITGGPGTNVVITITFPRSTGTTPVIQDLYNWSYTTNIVVVSPPTLTVNTGNSWTYSLTITVTNNQQAFVFFCARLSAGAHAVPGGSQKITGTGGSLQIFKPGAGSGTPDLSIVKTGPAFINAGSFVTYTLSYSNTTVSTAGGVEITDFLPTNAVFVSCSDGCTGATNNSTIVWDLGLLDKGASGSVSYTVFVSTNTLNGSTILNQAAIATADSDSNSANDTSSVSSIVTNGCVTATIGAPPDSVVGCSGLPATFSVGANGTTPYAYQWQKNGTNISGATSSFYTIASASAADVASYRVIVTNNCGSVTSVSATLTLNTSTTASALTNQTACPGNNVTFSTTASGTGPFTYQWQKNGSNLTTQTNSSILLTNVSAADSATYSVVVTGTCNSVTNSATLSVNTLASSSGLTSIANNCSGTTAAFTEVVSGTGPFTYVWKKNNVLVSGQTSSSFVIPATATSDSGSYTVEVTGSCNKLTNSATLVVNTGTFGTALTNLVVCPGNPASFSTVASGASPFSYQWRKNGSNISGQTTSAYNIGSVLITDAGTYSVEITGNCNKITNSATLAVNTPLSGGSFGGQTVCAGQSATFSTVPAGSAPFTYVWKKDGVVQGSTSNSLTVVSATTGDAGTYTVEINGPCNSMTNSGTLTVNSVTTASALISLTNCPGQSATFSTVASGTSPFTYVWKKNGVVQSSTSSSLTVASVSGGDAGTYTVVVTGACNSVTNSATLTVNTATTATALNNLTNCVGQSVAFSTAASGTGPFSYAWKKDGIVQGSTSNTLSIASIATADAGSYTVEITGTCNSVTNSATLTVNALTTATALTPIITCEGQSAIFSTTASGAGPFTYVWKKNGVNLGNSSSSLTIALTAIADSGTYSVEVTGVCNSVTNSSTLTVNALTTATALNSQTNCVGQSATFTTTPSGTGPFTYVWKKDGAVQSSILNTLVIPSVSTADAGTYTVEVTGNCNSVTNSATLTMNSPTTASSLTSSILCPGQSATFTTTASGSGPFVYVWKKNGAVQSSTSNTLTIGSVASGDAGTYTVEVTGTCNSATNTATLTVNDPTTATVLNSLTICPGQSAAFGTTASGTGPFTYVWKKDGVVQASTTNLLTIASATSADAGSYTVEVTGACNSVTNSATLTVNANTGATGLVDLALCSGQSATFSTTASGTGPFSYVWKKDGVVLGTTTNTLTIASIATADGGIYTVEVTGACNSVTNSATLTVNELTTATPLVDVVTCGQSAIFSTVVSGAGPFTYIWKKNGVVQSSTTNSLTVPSVTSADAGTYTVEVSGTCNSVTNSATLTVNADTSATALNNQVVCPGQSATFSTVASGSGPFTYVWKKDGVVQSSVSSSLTIASVASSDAGTYTVEVNGACNSTTNSATLTVNTPTSASALSSLVVCPGQSATFTTVPSGTGPFTYVWKKDGVVQTSVTNFVTIASAAAADAGIYTVEVTGACNSVTNSATLTVNENTAATSLTDLVLCPGQSAAFTTTVSGTGPFGFVWKKDGAVLPGETTNTISIMSVTAANAGIYTVEVTGVCNAVTNTATLTVNANVSATALSDVVVCENQPATFSTTASGTGPLAYVWKKDGSVLSGQTDSSISIASAQVSDAGMYTVEVTGLCTSVTNSATLTVNRLTTTSDLTSVVVCPTQSATFTTVPSGTGPFTYAWSKDGQLIASETTDHITLNNVTAANAGTYSVHVTGICNSADKSATLTVNENTAATSLTDLVLCPGQSAAFTTTVSGTGPLGFVWKKDGVELIGETTNTISIASVTAANAGIYTVEVTGVCNAVTNTATLTVNENVSATALTDVLVCENQPAAFSTTASGTGPLAYVWKKDGSVLAGQTDSSISIASTQVIDAGMYTVEVTGLCTSVTNSATLTVNRLTTASDLTSLVVCPTQSATFTTVPSGTGPFSFVWSKDGQAIATETTDHITLNNVTAANAGTYSVHVTGICNSADKSATLTVNENTAATSLTDLVLCPGQPAAFTTTVSGTGPFGFVWKKDGVVLSAETTNTISIASVTAANAGTYTVEVTGVCNSVTNTTTLTVNENVSATALSDVVVCENQPATFSTTASGTGPLAYVWKKDGSVLPGQSDSSISIASAQVSDAGMYTVEVTGLCTSVTNSATLTVNRLTTTSDLTSLVVCPTQSATFTTVPSGTGPFSFVWSKDGQAIATETTDHITIAGVTAADGGTYSVHVTGICNSADKSATLTVNENTSASPVASLVLCPGQAATFTTVAAGTGPLTYVWKKDGVVQSSTSNTLSVASVTATDAGTYLIEITGTCTSVTNAATLTVNENTAATALNDLVLCPGQSTTFATVVTGTGPFGFVWKKDGVVLVGQTTNSFSIGPVTAIDAGTYTVEVTGVCTSVTNNAVVTINQNVSSSALTDLAVCQGAPATFSTTPAGTGPYTYVWRKDGAVLSGESQNSLTIASADLGDTGTYSVEVAGVCTAVTNSATLIVNTTTTSSDLTGLTLCPGQNATFSTTPSGTGPFTYAWSKDGQVMASETADHITINGVTAANAGTYNVHVTGTCNSVDKSATLTVNENTAATSLTDLVLCPTQSATFTTTVSGTGPFGYVWKKDGVVLVGETTNTISVASITAVDAGTYTVEVSGLCNGITNNATLTVNENVSATALTDVVVCENQLAAFSTTASGTGPFVYVWKKDGNVLSGQTDSSISIASAQVSDAGMYTVEVTGLCTSVTNAATLTVNRLTSASDLTSLVVCPGQSATFTTVPSGTGAFTYVWSKDGQTIVTETTDHITLDNVTEANAGTYSVHVTGTCNSVDKSATLTVNENTSATALTSLVLCPGQTATFTTVASGTGPLSYVWKKNGTVQSSTSNTLTVASVASGDAGTYTVEVGGTCTSVTNAATLTVNENTAATALTSLVLCPGQPAIFTTVASGTGPLTYVWKKDGVPQSSTSNALTIAAVTSTDAGNYTIEVTGTCTSVTNVATLTVNENTAATSLTDLVLCPGQSAAFTTTVSGTGPFGFVWKKDGAVLAGETTNTISIASVTATNAGSYTVEVTGVCNNVTNTATLTVNANVSATALTDVMVCENQPAIFSTTTSGTGPLAYVWKKDGNVLPAQTDSSINIASAQVIDAGMYTVEVTGLCTSMTNSATLTVNRLTTTSDLTSLVVCPTQSATFTTVTSGTGPFSFVWTKDGQVIATETTDHITLNNVTAADAGTYSVHVTGICNSADKSATLTVNENTAATSLTDLVLCPGQLAVFTTTVSGTGPFGFVWKKDGVVLPGETTNTINIASVTASNAGTYTVEVTGVCNNVTNTATLTVNTNVSATALTDVVVCENQPATFSTTASGTGPLAYVWKKDGSVLQAQTDSSISIASAQVSDAGMYTVEVTGFCTSVTNGATLTVNRLTTTSDLASLIVCPGQSATFTTVPSGTAPFSFVWSKDGQVIATETTDHITLNSVAAANAGTYSVHVTGTCNSADKSATLTVNQNASATALTSLVLCPGQAATFLTIPSGTGPFSYVWKKNGVAQSSTSNSLVALSITSGDAGTYTVEVSGMCTSVTNSATLTVNTNTSATAVVDLVRCPGTTATFSTAAAGTGPITYVWKKNGQTLNGQMSPSLSLTLVSASDSGTYSVEVSGTCNTVTNSATLSIGTLAATPLVDTTACQNQPVTFSTVATGNGPFSYVWKKNGATIGTATTSAYTIASAQTSDAGTYSVVVSTSCLSVTNTAALAVNQSVTASALVALTRCPGQSGTFTTVVGGTGPFTFVWKQNGQILAGQTTNSLTFSSLANSNSGTYSVEVGSFCNSVTNSAILTVKTNASATPVGDYTVCSGQSVTFTTTATGTVPFSYRWRRNGSVISGATASALTIASATTTNAGTYSVEVTGSCNTATNFGSLTVATQTTITPLADQNICSAENVIVFSTTPSGGAPFTFTWKTNGTVISGQTTNVLVLTNVPPSTNAYIVSVDVTGLCGSASTTANLMVYGITNVTGAITFGSGQDIKINDNQPATPYPANIFVHCIPGIPKKVTVTLLNVSHTYPKDINAMLVSPSGQAVPLMIECGGGDPISFVTLTFDDAASSSLPQTDQIVSGIYKPTSYLSNPEFPAPAPAPNAVDLSSLAGRDPTGTWSLYVLDDEIIDDGFIKGGWELTLFYGDDVAPKFIDWVYLDDGTFQTTLIGTAGLTHVVQASTDLVNWTSVATNTLPTGSFLFTTPVPTTGAKQFYRAIRTP